MSTTKRIERFSKYNISRKIRAISYHQEKSAFLFKIVPFLLHSNYADLPGYVDNSEAVYGIHRFAPQKYISRDLFLQYFQNSTALQKDTPSPFTKTPVIHSLKTIGSIGTIAQTMKSDCDYWVSILDTDLGPTGRSLLETKCKLIENWATTLGYEIYFFLMDIDQTRENSFESKAEDESAGTALKLLLKDELFRTHIQVAGKMLLWWLIPPGLSENGYKKYVKKLEKEDALDLNNYIDLGYISDIPKSEIFGACLWQMNKALDSPFKSIIKFAYLELLLSDNKNNIRLFSDRIKLLVTFPDRVKQSQFKNFKLDDIDPYLLLSREIIAFYQNEITDKKRGEFIRKCLLLKTLEGIDSQNKGDEKIAHLLKLTDLMREWDLLPKNVQFYLNFREWNFSELLGIGTQVHDYLSDTYKRLRTIFNTIDEGTKTTINEHDISVLGRKLFTFHDKKPDKIEFAKGLSRDTMAQKKITLHASRFDGADYFFAFQGEYKQVSIQEESDHIIKRDGHLLRLVLWLIINGILTPKSELFITKNYLPTNLTDIRLFVGQIFESFPITHFSHISTKELLKKEVIVKALAIINFSKAAVRGSQTLQTTFVSTNSYGEYFLHDYTTLSQYKNALTLLLTKHFVSRWNKNLDIFIVPQQESHLLQNMISS